MENYKDAVLKKIRRNSGVILSRLCVGGVIKTYVDPSRKSTECLDLAELESFELGNGMSKEIASLDCIVSRPISGGRTSWPVVQSPAGELPGGMPPDHVVASCRSLMF